MFVEKAQFKNIYFNKADTHLLIWCSVKFNLKSSADVYQQMS